MSKAQFPWQFKMSWSKVLPDLKVEVPAPRPRRTQQIRGERFPVLPSITPEKPISPLSSRYSWAKVVQWLFGTWFKTPLQRSDASYAKKVQLQQSMIEEFLQLGRGTRKIPHEKLIDETGSKSFSFELLQNYLRMSPQDQQTYDELWKWQGSFKRHGQLQQEFWRETESTRAKLQSDEQLFQKEREIFEVEKKMYKLQVLQREFLFQVMEQKLRYQLLNFQQKKQMCAVMEQELQN